AAPAPARGRPATWAVGVVDQRPSPGRWRPDRIDQRDGCASYQVIPSWVFPRPAVPLRAVVRRDEARRAVALAAAPLRPRLARLAGAVDGAGRSDGAAEAPPSGPVRAGLSPGGAVPHGRGVRRDDRLPVRAGREPGES